LGNKSLNKYNMYNIDKINFPEGTKINVSQPFGFDSFDGEIYMNNLLFYSSYMGYDDMRTPVYKPLNTENVHEIHDLLYSTISTTYFPPLNIMNCSHIRVGNLNGATTGVGAILVLDGGSYKLNSFDLSNVDIIYYNYNYTWDKLKALTPASTQLIPYGDIPVKVRCLKDGEWLDGSETIEYADIPMEYLGGGLYGMNMPVRAYDRYQFPIRVGEYVTSVVVSDAETVIRFGDNTSSTFVFSGQEVYELITENYNGWYYDSDVDGIRNNVIGDNRTTRMTISVPSDEIEIVYGQSSEKNYDYCIVYDGVTNNKIKEYKGVEGDNITDKLTSSSGIFIFEYKKDGSGANGKDAFWLKSLTYSQLPPYPDN
jgi:hypothetical protein